MKWKYKDVEYIVHINTEIGHYCGYVRIPDNHPDNKKVDKTEIIFGRKINTGYDDIDINCHGGLTFCKRITNKNKDNFPQGFSLGAWIGWDYGHYRDKTNYFNGVEYIEKEVEEECKNVINQLLTPSSKNEG